MTVCKMTACHESFSILILNVWRKKEFAGIRDDPRDSVHKNVKQSVSKKTFFGNNLTPVGSENFVSDVWAPIRCGLGQAVAVMQQTNC